MELGTYWNDSKQCQFTSSSLGMGMTRKNMNRLYGEQNYKSWLYVCHTIWELIFLL